MEEKARCGHQWDLYILLNSKMNKKERVTVLVIFLLGVIKCRFWLILSYQDADTLCIDYFSESIFYFNSSSRLLTITYAKKVDEKSSVYENVGNL